MAKTSRVVRQAEIPTQFGQPSPEIAQKWLKQQIPYKNYAGLVEDLDQHVLAYASGIRQHFYTRMSAPMKRWSFNWSTSNTEALWQENEDDVHIPETKKALDNKVARIEEAITSFDPVFEVEGLRGPVSRRDARLIGSYVYRQMELANWQELVQPLARDAELCNVQAVKVVWEELVEWVVEREWKQKYRENGLPYYSDTRRMRQAVAKRGVRYHQVDPFWLIYDIDAPNPRDGSYVGDESEVFLHELEAKADLGWFSKDAVAKIRDNIGRELRSDGKWFLQDFYRRARSIALVANEIQATKGEHEAKRCRVLELWSWFDFKDGFDGVTDPNGVKLTGAHRVVITIANNVVIRFQLNPFDRKFSPYAIERINKNGHEMVAPAPFDAVVQMNAHYDRLSSNIMRWMDLMAAPIALTSDVDGDLPRSLTEVKAGTIMRATGQFDWIKPPDITSAVGYFQSYFRREMEETSGALRVFENGPQGTATETERKVQEQQRAIRASIRSNSSLWQQVARITHWMMAQFVAGPEVFTIAGRGGNQVAKSFQITPDILQEDVDFRFLGLANLHVFGNRTQGMSQWMQRWGSLLPNSPEVNLPALMRLDFEMTVGKANLADVFPDSDPTWDMMSQKEENAALLAGRAISTHPDDDDAEHLRDLVPLFKNESVPAYVKQMAFDHAQEHYMNLQRKKAQEEAQRKAAEQKAAMQGPGGGEPGVDRAPAYGGLPAQKDKGVTPGPDQARTVARTGRSGGGASQSQVMQ